MFYANQLNEIVCSCFGHNQSYSQTLVERWVNIAQLELELEI